MKIITMYNNKGGVGKTTSVINVAYSLSKMGKKVLVMDFDEQRNSSRFFLDENFLNFNQEIPQAAATRYKDIYIIAYSELNKKINEEQTKKFEEYDYVIFDLPPALNNSTRSMLCLCDYVFVPIELGTFAIQGISVVVDVLSKISAKFAGCFVVKFDNENPSDYSLLDVLKNALGAKVLTSIIPFSRVIKNSISYCMTAAEYMEYMVAAEKYNDLTKEIVELCD